MELSVCPVWLPQLTECLLFLPSRRFMIIDACTGLSILCGDFVAAAALLVRKVNVSVIGS